MSAKSFSLQITKKLSLHIDFATELWFNTLASGEIHVHLFNFGWYEKKNYNMKIVSLTFLWMLIRIVKEME